jgi:phytoene dehydrogenase-like protein
MSVKSRYDAIIVGAGPNGLSAAITLARAGWSVLALEANATVGGAARSAELTLPGFVHDVCSPVHPLAFASPFFRTLPLVRHGLEWIHPPAPLAHPFDDGSAAVLERSVEETGWTLGADADAWRKLMAPLVDDWDRLEGDLLGPPQWPRHPLTLARFGLLALRSARGLAERLFRGPRAVRGSFGAFHAAARQTGVGGVRAGVGRHRTFRRLAHSVRRRAEDFRRPRLASEIPRRRGRH